jgi:hypothetical protein
MAHGAAAPEPRIEGAAFTPLVKALASLLMAGLILYGIRAFDAFIADRQSWSLILFLALLAGLSGYCFWWMLISRTTVTATHLRQTWWSEKRVAITDITQTKLILVPGLTWLIAPRLVVRTRAAGSVVFHAAEPPLIAAFARLSLGLSPLGD